jgi:hypothetical protein
MKEICKLE